MVCPRLGLPPTVLVFEVVVAAATVLIEAPVLVVPVFIVSRPFLPPMAMGMKVSDTYNLLCQERLVPVAQCIGIDDLSEGETCPGRALTRASGDGDSRSRGGGAGGGSGRTCGASVHVLSPPHGHSNHGELVDAGYYS